MTVAQRKKDLKSKIVCVSLLAFIQLIWIIPVGIKIYMDNQPTETEVKESESETVEKESVYIEKVEDTVVMAPVIEVETETQIETEVEAEKEPTYFCEWMGVEFSQSDFELLCRTTYCESGDQTYETQVMVCLAILNRYSAGYSDTIHGVVYQENQFAVTNWKDFEQRSWNEKTEQAVLEALKENNHPRDMYYFRDGYYHRWAVDYMVSDEMYFSTKN